MAHKKRQHARTPLHARWSFPWLFRALLKGGPPLFLSSFLFFFFRRCSFFFCNMKPTGTEKNNNFGGRRWSFGRVVGSSDISRTLPSCGSNRTIFPKHHRSQGRLSYCAAFSDLLVGVSTIPFPPAPIGTRNPPPRARLRA